MWQGHHVEGHTWNTLDQLYNSNALTFDGLYEKLKPWGVPQDIHIQDLQELITRGWVEEKSSEVEITSAGKQVREGVEAETERLFFLPWSCLSESEQEDLMNLSTQLHNGLNNLKEKE